MDQMLSTDGEGTGADRSETLYIEVRQDDTPVDPTDVVPNRQGWIDRMKKFVMAAVGGTLAGRSRPHRSRAR